MKTIGMKWTVDEAKIEDCGTFQTDEGEAMAYAKLAYFGGMISLKVTPHDMRKIEPHKGKIVSVSGGLRYEVKKGSGKEMIRFSVNEVKVVG